MSYTDSIKKVIQLRKQIEKLIENEQDEDVKGIIQSSIYHINEIIDENGFCGICGDEFEMYKIGGNYYRRCKKGCRW